MNSSLGFVVKVLVLSTVISILIKISDRLISIPATSLNAAIAVFLPTVILALLLIWRSRNSMMILKKAGGSQQEAEG
jgi:membrane protein implicated in regulation of membrane protease activity